MKVALVCIAKNEDKYIQEWIDYNLKLGFDSIFIYQNDWRTDIENPKVVKLEMDGINKQRDSYNHFLRSYHKEYDWVAFFDVDEFLVLKKHDSIKKFIHDYKEFPGIGVNWVLFGNNGLTKTNGDYSSIKRFTKRQWDVNPHIKTIMKVNPNVMMDVHNPNIYLVDTNKNKFSGPFNTNGQTNIAQLNHYFCKTQEEFEEKCKKGRADSSSVTRKMSEFDAHNFNDIEDLTAYNFLYK
jgi:hypothetical protein